MTHKEEIEHMLNSAAELIEFWDGRSFILDSKWEDGMLTISFHDLEEPALGPYSVSALRLLAGRAEDILNETKDPVTESRWKVHSCPQCYAKGKPCNEWDDCIDSVSVIISRQYK